MKLSPAFLKQACAVLCLLYILLCPASSVFFIRAFFRKGIANLCGKVWLGLTALFCAAQLLPVHGLAAPFRALRRQDLLHPVSGDPLLAGAGTPVSGLPAVMLWMLCSSRPAAPCSIS